MQQINQKTNINRYKMKNLIQKYLKNATGALMLAAMSSSAYAQKLNNIQEGSLWAPANLKVDGNLKEWDDNYQAYNKATKIFYSVTNDDKNLYLVVKSIDIQNSNKIAAGGITFTVNTQDKKKDKDAFNITYPVIPRTQRQRGQGGPGGFGGGGRDGGPGGFDRGRDGGNLLDSAAMAAQHKRTIDAAKEIRLSGFKDITDSLISIYNEYGIKAAIGYDKIGNYNYELAIPLKYLGLSVDNVKEFAYNLKVNGITMPNFGGPGGPGGQGGPGGGGPGGGGFGGGGRDGGGPGGRDGGRPDGDRGGDRNFMEMFSATDFWGKYTLAKK